MLSAGPDPNHQTLEVPAAYALLGDRDTVMTLLEEAYRRRSIVVIFLHVDPLYESLHGDRRFQDLLRKLNFD